MENNKTIDQSVLANDVSNKIPYEFVDCFLVKPLDAIKVTKEFSKPVSDKKPIKDENGIEAVDYDKVETETKEVDSDFRKGVVLKMPHSYKEAMNDSAVKYMTTVKVGDIIVFKEHPAYYFDLLKDTRLVRYYDIVAIENDNN